MVSKTQMIGESPALAENTQEPKAALPANEIAATPERATRQELDPTRFGDWEKNGRCIDF